MISNEKYAILFRVILLAMEDWLICYLKNFLRFVTMAMP